MRWPVSRPHRRFQSGSGGRSRDATRLRRRREDAVELGKRRNSGYLDTGTVFSRRPRFGSSQRTACGEKILFPKGDLSKATYRRRSAPWTPLWMRSWCTRPKSQRTRNRILWVERSGRRIRCHHVFQSFRCGTSGNHCRRSGCADCRGLHWSYNSAFCGSSRFPANDVRREGDS